MSKKNENLLINACLQKSRKINDLEIEIKVLKNEIVDLIEVFQILQKTLDFEFAFDINGRKFIISNCFDEINIFDYEKLNIVIERYGIK